MENKEQQVTQVTNETSQMDNNATNKANKKSKKGLIIVICAVVVILLGLAVVYFGYIGNSKRIVSNAISTMSNKVENIFKSSDSATNIGDNIKAEGNIKLDIKSDYINTLSTYDTNYTAYKKLIDNLSKTDNNFSLIQNKDDKKLFASLDSSFGGSELINAKYLIQNNKQYYFVTGFLDSYIDNGENNYFESLDESETSAENIEYIYNFMINSFKNNLKGEYFTKTNVTTKINGKDEKVTKVTLVMNNKNSLEIATAVLDDLKNDKKASKILTGYDKDFKDTKIENTENIFDEGDQININVYTDSITYKAKMYELEIIEGKTSNSLTYYEGEKNTVLTLKSNNKDVGYLTITSNSFEKIIKVTDAKNKEIATAVVTVKGDNTKAVINATIEGMNLDMTIDSKVSNVKKKESYDSETTVTCKITAEGMDVLDATISANMNVTNDAKINEDVKEAVSSNEITATQEEKLQTILTDAMIKLMI